jgi:hypothetical protein
MAGFSLSEEIVFGRICSRLAVVVAAILATFTGYDTCGLAAERSPYVEPSPNTYCGLHCVYSILRQNGIDIEFTELLDDRFLSHGGSSSAEDLCAALEVNGLEGRYVPAMAIDRLLLLEGPAILHVRAPGMDKGYVHWILFLGSDADGVKVYDPPREIGHCRIDELLAIWDGAAVLVAKPGTSNTMGAVLPWISPSAATVVALLVCSILVVPRSAGILGQLAVAVIAAFAFHVCAPWGFVHGRPGVAAVQSEHFAGVAGRIAFDELRQGRSAYDHCGHTPPAGFRPWTHPGCNQHPCWVWRTVSVGVSRQVA